MVGNKSKHKHRGGGGGCGGRGRGRGAQPINPPQSAAGPSNAANQPTSAFQSTPSIQPQGKSDVTPADQAPGTSDQLSEVLETTENIVPEPLPSSQTSQQNAQDSAPANVFDQSFESNSTETDRLALRQLFAVEDEITSHQASGNIPENSDNGAPTVDPVAGTPDQPTQVTETTENIVAEPLPSSQGPEQDAQGSTTADKLDESFGASSEMDSLLVKGADAVEQGITGHQTSENAPEDSDNGALTVDQGEGEKTAESEDSEVAKAGSADGISGDLGAESAKLLVDSNDVVDGSEQPEESPVGSEDKAQDGQVVPQDEPGHDGSIEQAVGEKGDGTAKHGHTISSTSSDGSKDVSIQDVAAQDVVLSKSDNLENDTTKEDLVPKHQGEDKSKVKPEEDKSEAVSEKGSFHSAVEEQPPKPLPEDEFLPKFCGIARVLKEMIMTSIYSCDLLEGQFDGCFDPETSITQTFQELRDCAVFDEEGTKILGWVCSILEHFRGMESDDGLDIARLKVEGTTLTRDQLVLATAKATIQHLEGLLRRDAELHGRGEVWYRYMHRQMDVKSLKLVGLERFKPQEHVPQFNSEEGQEEPEPERFEDLGSLQIIPFYLHVSLPAIFTIVPSVIDTALRSRDFWDVHLLDFSQAKIAASTSHELLDAGISAECKLYEKDMLMFSRARQHKKEHKEKIENLEKIVIGEAISEDDPSKEKKLKEEKLKLKKNLKQNYERCCVLVEKLEKSTPNKHERILKLKTYQLLVGSLYDSTLKTSSVGEVWVAVDAMDDLISLFNSKTIDVVNKKFLTNQGIFRSFESVKRWIEIFKEQVKANKSEYYQAHFTEEALRGLDKAWKKIPLGVPFDIRVDPELALSPSVSYQSLEADLCRLLKHITCVRLSCTTFKGGRYGEGLSMDPDCDELEKLLSKDLEMPSDNKKKNSSKDQATKPGDNTPDQEEMPPDDKKTSSKDKAIEPDSDKLDQEDTSEEIEPEIVEWKVKFKQVLEYLKKIEEGRIFPIEDDQKKAKDSEAGQAGNEEGNVVPVKQTKEQPKDFKARQARNTLLRKRQRVAMLETLLQALGAYHYTEFGYPENEDPKIEDPENEYPEIEENVYLDVERDLDLAKWAGKVMARWEPGLDAATISLWEENRALFELFNFQEPRVDTQTEKQERDEAAERGAEEAARYKEWNQDKSAERIQVPGNFQFAVEEYDPPAINDEKDELKCRYEDHIHGREYPDEGLSDPYDPEESETQYEEWGNTDSQDHAHPRYRDFIKIDREVAERMETKHTREA